MCDDAEAQEEKVEIKLSCPANATDYISKGAGCPSKNAEMYQRHISSELNIKQPEDLFF